jgi:hypothetical protein
MISRRAVLLIAFGPLAVNGDISSNLFGQVANTAPPREVQGAVNFFF